MREDVLELDTTFAAVEARTTNTQNTLVPTENVGASAITSISSGSSGIGASVVGGVATLVSPLTAKGDIFVRNATVGTRLPVGGDFDVLTADSGEATGLRYTKNNVDAAAPAITDDSDAGYSQFSRWIDTTPIIPDVYECVNASIGAAVWVKLS